MAFVFGTAAPLCASGGEPPRAYPPYPVAGDIDEYPRQNSVMPFLVGRVGLHGDAPVIGVLPGLEVYLRDAFSVRAGGLIPLTKRTHAGASGFAPFLLMVGGALHLLGSERIDPYVLGASGLEVNRNPTEASAVQPFVEVGAGLQSFFFGWLAVRLEYAYHLSYVPQSDGSFADGAHSTLQLGGGVFF